MTTAPPRSTGQRLTALERANEVRSARAVLKTQIKRGLVLAVEVLRSPPEYTAKMKVVDLLLAMPKTGEVKATKVLDRCGISTSRTIGGLTERQRRELAGYIERARLGMTRSDQAPLAVASDI